jgi:phosphatidylserine/phosphatidylglycerophosphate/cardiolipin synthase-like enzyme
MVGRGYYKDLLSVNESPEVRACSNTNAGLRIWEWTGQAPGETARSQGTMHSKFAVVDGTRALVGSYNLDPRSEKLNSETAVVFLEPALAGNLRHKFIDDDLTYGREVTPEMASTFENPESAIERFRKSIGHLFEAEL